MDYLNPNFIDGTEQTIWLAGKCNMLTNYLARDIITHFVDLNDKATDEYYKDNKILLSKSTTVAELNDICSEPPFFGTYYLLHGDFSDLENKVKSRLLKILKEAPPYLISVINISNYGEFKKLSTDTRMTGLGKVIYCFRPDIQYRNKFVRAYLGNEEIPDKAINLLGKRADTQDNFFFYLNRLKGVEDFIDSEYIKHHIPDCRTYSILDYLRYTLLPDKKTLHIKALNDCLSKFRRKTYSEIVKNLLLLLEIKKLSTQGQIILVNLKEDLERLSSSSKLSKTLSDMSAYAIRPYLELANELTLAELHIIYLLFVKLEPNAQKLYLLTDIIHNRREDSSDLLEELIQNKLKL